MRLHGLRETELFTFLLCCGQLHHLTKVANVEVAEELVVSRLDIVPYIRTFVQYDGTFGVPD
jgi:hypothetical protein